ncbi:unnamed protein product [Ectocarpus fasciculatus]
MPDGCLSRVTDTHRHKRPPQTSTVGCIRCHTPWTDAKSKITRIPGQDDGDGISKTHGDTFWHHPCLVEAQNGRYSVCTYISYILPNAYVLLYLWAHSCCIRISIHMHTMVS